MNVPFIDLRNFMRIYLVQMTTFLLFIFVTHHKCSGADATTCEKDVEPIDRSRPHIREIDDRPEQNQCQNEKR